MANYKEILLADEKEVELSEWSKEINLRLENKEAREIISEIKKTMRVKGLNSLSAPAIGYQRRIFCIDFKDREIKTFINPIIVNAKGLQLSREKCTSIPGKEFIRPRNNEIEVMYQDPMSKPQSRKLVGLAAIVFQHEQDHLDGLLLSDVGLEVDELFDNASEEEKQEVIEAYLDSLDLKQKDLQTEIQEDKELKQMDDARKYMESVYKGETKIEGLNDYEQIPTDKKEKNK